MALSSEVHDQIRDFVWCGFFLRDDVRRFFCGEVFDLQGADADDVASAIDHEFSEKAIAEKKWPEETDCDRLDRLFDELNQEGIIAIHNAGREPSDGSTKIAAEYERRGGDRSGYTGYCVYHRHDLVGAVRGHGLYLTFGPIEGYEEAGTEVGRRIKQKCEKFGFRAQLDAAVGSSIKIEPLTWLRRGARMTLEVASGETIKDPSEDDLLAAIGSEPFAILSSGDGIYIQCAQREDAYQLEYQDGPREQHYEAADIFVDADQVITAFWKYLNGDDSWRTDIEWKEYSSDLDF